MNARLPNTGRTWNPSPTQWRDTLGSKAATVFRTQVVDAEEARVDMEKRRSTRCMQQTKTERNDPKFSKNSRRGWKQNRGDIPYLKPLPGHRTHRPPTRGWREVEFNIFFQVSTTLSPLDLSRRFKTISPAPWRSRSLPNPWHSPL